MSTKFYTLLTEIGAAKLANATATGVPLKITQMAVGDGAGTLPTPSAQQTKLISEKRRAGLNQLYIDPQNASQIIAEQVIPENEGGFWIREIGLFDDSGELIAIGNCAESYKPQLNEGSGRTQTVRMILITRSTDNVTLKTDPAIILATRKYVDDKVIELTVYIDKKMSDHIADNDPHTQYAPKASPELTGVPTAPTAGPKANSNQIATTEFVQSAIAAQQSIITSQDFGSFTFSDIASGLAGTTDGQYFRVPQGVNAQESFIYYKNENSTAVEVAKTLGQGALDKLDKLTEQVDGVATLIRFKDDSRYSAAWVDDDGFVVMALTISGELVTYGGVNGMVPRDTSRYAWGISSEDGSIVIGVKNDATVEIPFLHAADLDIKTTSRYPLVWKDESGNIVFAVNDTGKVIVDLDSSVSSALTEHSVTLATADTIMHVGDSLTESIWVVKDKAWMSVLSAFSPYRHVNYGVAGNTVLQMQTRVLNGTSVYGSNLQQIKPRFGFLSSFGNDYFMMDTDMKYYQESVQRAVDVMKPYCGQVVLVTEFCATQNIRTVYEEVARQNNLPYIHTDTLAYQLGKIPLGDQSLFHQGHIGTRNQGIWWYQILDWIKQQPIRKGIKIYRARTTPSAISDLVFKNDYERHKKFKELTVGHTYLTGAKDYDEIGDSTVSASMPQAKANDEYLTLQNGGALANTYSLVEVYLDQHPKDIQSLIINVASSAATVYALSSTDGSVNISASSLTDAFKTSYANPRSVWKPISQGQVIANSQLPSLFTGRKLSLLVVGGTLVNPQVTYKSKDRPFRQEIYPYVKQETLGSELASARIVGDSGWTLSSNIKTLKPIDNKFMVRAPDSTTQLTDVFKLPVGESLAQNISFTAKEDPRKFRVQAFARYFPKGYLDLTKSIYSGLDANQTMDSTVSTNSAPVTADSLDVYRLFAEIEVSDGGYNRPGGATDYSDIVGLTWKPVTFYVHTAPYANQLKIKLTTPDGELQIARFSVKEVI